MYLFREIKSRNIFGYKKEFCGSFDTQFSQTKDKVKFLFCYTALFIYQLMEARIFSFTSV